MINYKKYIKWQEPEQVILALNFKLQDENEMLSDWKRHKPLLKGGRYFPLAGGDRPEISHSN